MIIDINNKFVKVEDIEGIEQAVAFIEYREHENEKMVRTGPFGCLPHLDPFYTGVELLTAVREKYPQGEWILETEPAWCARPEYIYMIQRGIDEGHVFYDEVGEYISDHPGLLEGWEFRDFAFKNPNEEVQTNNIWQALQVINNQIQNANNS